MADKNPFETAREALKRLSARKLAPTPANYQSVYNEIAGTTNVVPFPEEAFRSIVRALPAQTTFQKEQKSLFERAVGQRSWDGVQSVFVGYANVHALNATASGEVAPQRRSQTDLMPAAGAELREGLARMIENAMPALGTDDERLLRQSEALVTRLRDPAADRDKLKSAVAEFTHRLSFAAEDQAEIRAALLKLLHTVIDNIGAIGIDERWVQPQLDALASAATPPLSLRRLDDLERRLSDVMVKQINAKGRTLEAQAELRAMLATFVERLAQVSDSTAAYHRNLEEGARRLEQATSLEEFAPVLRNIIGATRDIAIDIMSTRDELREMRERVDAAESQVAKLHEELNAASSQARHDALTGALNRKGLDEAMERELAEVRRKQTALCLALLDLDNFKKLNDSKGHETGDAALSHLVNVTRECMRTQDTLARYGGEEFVILLPDTALEDGIEAMVRLQRALTRRYFLAGNEQILITFSAGVAQFEPGESPEDAIKRADRAMYLAKRQGKNRVLGA
jgi:diguanylate cyclase